MVRDKKFFWIIWDFECPIARDKQKDFEEYLVDHEKNLIPKFLKHIADYAKFREEEMDSKYKFRVLREVRY